MIPTIWALVIQVVVMAVMVWISYRQGQNIGWIDGYADGHADGHIDGHECHRASAPCTMRGGAQN